MYAYRSQEQVRPLHALPERRLVTAPKRVVKKGVKQKQKKKKNIFLEFFRFIVSMTFLSAFCVFILPNAYHDLIKQVFYPTSIPTQGEYKNNMLKR